MTTASLIDSLAPSEAEPLLRHSAAVKPKTPPPLVSKLLDLALAVAVPWLTFVSILLFFLFLYKDVPGLAWGFAAAFAAGSSLVFCVGAATRHSLFMAVGWLCLAAVVAGVLLSTYLQAEYLDYYFQVRRGTRFTHVNPSDSPAHTPGAGVLQFIPGTIADDYRTIGFVSGGHIYCVAPIADQATEVYPQAINYWAAGVDCCEKRQKFNCGASQDPEALTTILAPPRLNFERAVAQAKSVYNITSPESAQLVTFVASVKQVQSGIWAEAINVILVAGAVHLGISLIAGIILLEMLPNAWSKPYQSSSLTDP